VTNAPVVSAWLNQIRKRKNTESQSRQVTVRLVLSDDACHDSNDDEMSTLFRRPLHALLPRQVTVRLVVGDTSGHDSDNEMSDLFRRPLYALLPPPDEESASMDESSNAATSPIKNNPTCIIKTSKSKHKMEKTAENSQNRQPNSPPKKRPKATLLELPANKGISQCKNENDKPSRILPSDNSSNNVPLPSNSSIDNAVTTATSTDLQKNEENPLTVMNGHEANKNSNSPHKHTPPNKTVAPACTKTKASPLNYQDSPAKLSAEETAETNKTALHSLDSPSITCMEVEQDFRKVTSRNSSQSPSEHSVDSPEIEQVSPKLKDAFTADQSSIFPKENQSSPTSTVVSTEKEPEDLKVSSGHQSFQNAEQNEKKTKQTLHDVPLSSNESAELEPPDSSEASCEPDGETDRLQTGKESRTLAPEVENSRGDDDTSDDVLFCTCRSQAESENESEVVAATAETTAVDNDDKLKGSLPTSGTTHTGSHRENSEEDNDTVVFDLTVNLGKSSTADYIPKSMDHGNQQESQTTNSEKNTSNNIEEGHTEQKNRSDSHPQQEKLPPPTQSHLFTSTATTVEIAEEAESTDSLTLHHQAYAIRSQDSASTQAGEEQDGEVTPQHKSKDWSFLSEEEAGHGHHLFNYTPPASQNSLEGNDRAKQEAAGNDSQMDVPHRGIPKEEVTAATNLSTVPNSTPICNQAADLCTTLPTTQEVGSKLQVERSSRPAPDQLRPHFETAGLERRIEVSSEALLQAERLLSAPVFDKCCPDHQHKSANQNMLYAPHLQTADEKAEIVSSEKGMAEATNLFRKDDHDEPLDSRLCEESRIIHNKQHPEKKDDEASSSTVLSVVGRDTETAATNTIGTHNNESHSNHEKSDILHRQEEQPAGTGVTSEFTLAGKSNLTVSKNAINRAGSLLHSVASSEQKAQLFQTGAPSGFQTAGKSTSLSVSKEAMLKAGPLWGSVESHEQLKPSSVTGVSSGFQTAGKSNSLTVSKEAMEKAGSLWNVSVSTAKQDHGSGAEVASGFQTAGTSSSLAVSKEAMKKAESLCNLEHSKREERTSGASVSSGFHTAGKSTSLAVSIKAMQKAGSLWGSVDSNAQKELLSGTGTAAVASSGFQTAGKSKSLTVSEEAMERAGSLWNSSVSTATQDQQSGAGVASGFRTAGMSSSLAVSKQAMKKAESLYDPLESNIQQERSSVAGVSSGFHTAGKSKSLAVSKKAMQKVGSLWGSLESNEQQVPLHGVGASSGFQTAGKSKSLTVSKEAMGKAGSLWNSSASNGKQDQPTRAEVSFETVGTPSRMSDSEEEKKRAESLCNPSKSSDWQAQSFVAGVSSGFQTAGKSTSLTVFKEAMDKVGSLWKLSESNEQQHQPSGAGVSSGFQTAGKSRSIIVSKEALEKAGSLSKPAASNQNPQHSLVTGFSSGFQTAGKSKSLTLSKEAMEKAGSLWKSSESNEMQHQPSGAEVSSGFQTAGKSRSIIVSKEALEKAGSLSKPSASNQNPQQPLVTGFSSGFQTAGKSKSLTLSKEAMEKVGYLWSSSDCFQQEERSSSAAVSSGTNKNGEATGSAVENRQVSEGIISSKGPDNSLGSSDQIDENDAHTKKNKGGKSSKEARRVSDIGAIPSNQLLLDMQSYPSSHSDQGRKTPYLVKGNLSKLRFSSPEVGPREGNTLAEFDPCPLQQRSDPLQQNFSTLLAVAEQCLASEAGHVECPEIADHEQFGITPHRGRSGAAAAVTMSAGCRKHKNKTESSYEEAFFDPVGSLSPSKIPPEGCEIDGIDKKLNLKERIAQSISMPNFESSWSDIAASWKLSMTPKAMTGDSLQCKCDGVHGTTMKVNSSNASSLVFLDTNQRSVPHSFCDEASSPLGLVGFPEDLRAALVSRGCKETELGKKWLLNHKRWIVWKLASYERRFSSVLGGILLSNELVLSQLYSRYCKEFRDGQRPALRKVLNKDMAASSMMILCVCQLFSHASGDSSSQNDDVGEPNTSISLTNTMELTDGWYSVHAVPDQYMCDLIQKGRIKVGTKLMVSGATLVGAEDGVDPLDENYFSEKKHCRVFIRISSNSCRLARWNSKLGFVAPSSETRNNKGLLRIKRIADVIPGGGFIPLIHVVVCRRYPMMFLHRQQKGKDGETITEAEEYKQRTEFERLKLNLIEKFTEEVEAECTEVSNLIRDRRGGEIEAIYLLLCFLTDLFILFTNHYYASAWIGG